MDEQWQRLLYHLGKGNFSALEDDLGGPDGFDRQIVAWHEEGKFENEPEMLAEALSCACMLGRTETAEILLDAGVDPYAGMKTWLAGPHYAVSGGHIETVRMLLSKGIALEIKNGYGGTVFDQAIWSAINEPKPGHTEIIQTLIEAGAEVDPQYVDWWSEQNIPEAAVKNRVSELLRRHAEFHARLRSEESKVADAEKGGNKLAIANALKGLGDIARRPPFTRGAANIAYSRAASIYHELGMPLEEAWVKRHIGINLEYAGQLEEAEKYYDKALALYRENAVEDTLDYANTVRNPAVVKARLGKYEDAKRLWDEAGRRYDEVGIIEGVIECQARMTEIAIMTGDLKAARESFDRAENAAARTRDTETLALIDEIRMKLENAENDLKKEQV